MVGANGVPTGAAMLTQLVHLGADIALVDILGAVGPLKARWTATDVRPIDGVGVTFSAGMTGVRVAGVLQMTQQTGLARWTLAVEAAHSVVTGCAVEADIGRAVVGVQLAVATLPAVDADALV